MNNSLVEQLIALPLSERVEIAQVLWESIDDELGCGPEATDVGVIALARRRAAELAANEVEALTHEQVLASAAAALAAMRDSD